MGNNQKVSKNVQESTSVYKSKKTKAFSAKAIFKQHLIKTRKNFGSMKKKDLSCKTFLVLFSLAYFTERKER